MPDGRSGPVGFGRPARLRARLHNRVREAASAGHFVASRRVRTLCRARTGRGEGEGMLRVVGEGRVSACISCIDSVRQQWLTPWSDRRHSPRTSVRNILSEARSGNRTCHRTSCGVTSGPRRPGSHPARDCLLQSARTRAGASARRRFTERRCTWGWATPSADAGGRVREEGRWC